MLENKIEELREKLNKECESEKLISSKVVELSQSLDELIVIYYNDQLKEKYIYNNRCE